jgi:hypothetical protein
MAHIPAPCKCWVDDGEDYNEPRIVYCPLHAQAPAMLNALAEAIEHIEGFYGRDIEDAYRRGDATEEERDTVLTARNILRVIDVGGTSHRACVQCPKLGRKGGP